MEHLEDQLSPITEFATVADGRLSEVLATDMVQVIQAIVLASLQRHSKRPTSSEVIATSNIIIILKFKLSFMGLCRLCLCGSPKSDYSITAVPSHCSFIYLTCIGLSFFLFGR